jgi:hypothetical protein
MLLLGLYCRVSPIISTCLNYKSSWCHFFFCFFLPNPTPQSLSRGETNKVAVVAWTTRFTRPSCLLLNVDQRSAPPSKLRRHTLSPCLSPGKLTVALRSNWIWMTRNTVPWFISGDAPKCQLGKFRHVDRKQNLVYRRLYRSVAGAT